MENQRLSALDTSFLRMEGPSTHMHVSAICLFPEKTFLNSKGYIDFDRLIRFIESKMHLVPRYRQKIMEVPLAQGRPIWIDDEDFNINFHVRHSALPRPGTMDQLKSLVGRINSQALDRTKPLWEFWLVEGIEKKRVAIISKIHHAMIDGVSGVDLAATLMDWRPTIAENPEIRPWTPTPPPKEKDLLVNSFLQTVDNVGKFIDSVKSSQSEIIMGKVKEITEGLIDLGGGVAGEGALAPKSPINMPIGPHRSVDWISFELKRLKEIRKFHGGTLNDVILSVISLGLKNFFKKLKLPIFEKPLKILIPVSTRTKKQQGTLGNQISMMILDMPVNENDTEKLVNKISDRMSGLKRSKQVLGAKALTNLSNVATSTILHQASRMQWQQRFMNTVVTNVPGPQIPLYLNGAEMEIVSPFVPLGPNIGLGFAIFSYNGKATIGINADAERFPDLKSLTKSLEQAVKSFEKTAKKAELENTGDLEASNPKKEEKPEKKGAAKTKAKNTSPKKKTGASKKSA